jgi:ABC-2 type transport system permease protein
MKKVGLIAGNTFKQRVRSASFLILTFAIPIMMVIAGAVPFIMNGDNAPLLPVGFVDQTGQLTPVLEVPVDDETLHLRPFDHLSAAREAFTGGEIAGILFIPEDYFAGEQIRFYAEDEPGARLSAGLRIFMQRALLPESPDWILERLNDPSDQTFIALNSGDKVAEGPALIIRFAAPAALAILLALALLFSSSQMGAAVVREKDQHALEMIITSLRPVELVAGKVLGVSLLSLTQLAIWGLGALLAVLLLVAGEIDLATMTLPWPAIFWALLLGVPGYFLFAVIAAGLGIVAGDSQQAQQLSGLLGVLAVVPLWFAGAVVTAPNGSTAVALTLFPLTAPVISLLRMAFTEVPLWQLLASFAILLSTLLAAIWLLARLFRVAMLMVGQTLDPRQIARIIRQA